MKKVGLYILFWVFFLNITSCDFIRTIAGRPTSEDIELKSKQLALQKKHEKDSLERAAAILKAQQDSIAAAQALREAGVRLSDVFAFGEPVTALEHRYHLIVGVYRTDSKAREQIDAARCAGFDVMTILFRNGVQAVAICASDDLKQIASAVEIGFACGVCPKDAWIHVNRKK